MIDRARLLVLLVPALFAGPACKNPGVPPASASRSPNVVVVLTDDQGWADVGVQGARGIATPHLDALAADGVRLTDFYVAQPVCSASRAALLTGCYPNRVGISGALGPGARHGIHPDETTLAELLRGRGYATACFGKWHLGHLPEFSPLRHGFDEFYGIPYSNDMWPHHPENPEAWGDLPTIDGERVVGLNTDQNRFTGDLTARAVDFIERNAARPFFLYVAHPMPHVPLHASAAFRGRSEAGLHGDVIEEIDASVGALRAALARTGNTARTLFVFTSDNGPWLSYGDHAGSAGPLREGKGTTFEGGVRVPFLAGEPGATSPHEALFFYYHGNDLEAVRAGRWKLHFPHGYRTMIGRDPGAGGTPGKYDYGARTELALYDLVGDPGETRDLAEVRPAVVAELSALADAMRADLGDDLTGAAPTGAREPGRVAR